MGNKIVGDNHSAYLVGEIGINHNADMEIVKKLIDLAAIAGLDAVKFQKRTPDLAVPKDQRDVMRDTPWGKMKYIDYRYKMEFGESEYAEIDEYSKSKKIAWFASVWDEEAVTFLEKFSTPAYKIPSASLTDHELLHAAKKTGKVVILSTGMSNMEQIKAAVNLLGMEKLILMQSTSTYPAAMDELNLRVVPAFREMFKCPIGYSGHEFEVTPSVCAVALGANMIERHITLDRNMWGSDQKASLDPADLIRLVKEIRAAELALGDGVKKVYESEMPAMKRLRRK